MNEYVESKVGGPGMALAVVGVLAIVGNLLALVVQLLSAVSAVMAIVNSGGGADAWIAWAMQQGWSLVSSLVGFCVAFVVVLAGMRLRAARSAGLVYTGSIFAMLPCCIGPMCCCFGLPVGVWAIMTMQDEQVKAAFAEG